MPDAILAALGSLLDPHHFLFLAFGVMLGMLIGILPGLGGTAMLSLLLPFVFGRAADTAIGLYSQAFSLMTKPVGVLTSPVTGLMVAGLSQAQGDRAAHTALVARFFRLVAVALFPCAAGLAAVAPEVMLVLGGYRWQTAGTMLAVLAPAPG